MLFCIITVSVGIFRDMKKPFFFVEFYSAPGEWNLLHDFVDTHRCYASFQSGICGGKEKPLAVSMKYLVVSGKSIRLYAACMSRDF